MKGITIATIGYFIIAFVTIVLILSLIGTKISPAVRNFYCSFSRGIVGILPLPSYMKPPLPSYCRMDGSVIIETVMIDTRIPERIEFIIAGYTLACWEKTGKLNLGQDTICYELVLKGVDAPGVTRDGVVRELGDSFSILDWRTDDPITTRKSIGISYNSDSKKIEVI